MVIILLIIFFIIFPLSIPSPVYWLYRFISSFINTSEKVNKRNKIRSIYSVLPFLICFCIFPLNSILVDGGVRLEMYSMGRDYTNSYKVLSSGSVVTFFVFFVLGIICAYLLSEDAQGLAPIPYVICNCILLINVYFSFMMFTDVLFAGAGDDFSIPMIWFIGYMFLAILFMYLTIIKEAMDEVRKRELDSNKEYTNKWFNKIYLIFVKYNTKPLFWVIILLPVLFIIQFVLILFGQQPDSFIKVFFDTSSYNYSKIVTPDPIILEGDSHYLCTVSARGHEKLVKPLRCGIRSNKRILVNRQLLIANAFENILEQYTPKIHKFIRYIYDKYGYPLSKHINTKISADFTYIVMKPLEWIFLLVLYCIDKNPENRINIQYSELRK